MSKFIRFIERKYLISDDNWKTFSIEKKLNGATEESDLDITTEVLLRNELGEARAEIILTEFKKIQDLLVSRGATNVYNQGYGSSFEIFSIAVIHRLDYTDVLDNYIINGSRDGGIDAIYYSGSEVYVYQIKLAFAPANIKTVMKNLHNEYVNTHNIIKSDIHDLLTFYKNNHDNIIRKNAHYITIAKNTSTKKDYTPRMIYDKYFTNLLTLSLNNDLELLLEIPDSFIFNDCYNICGVKQITYAYFVNAKDFINNLKRCPGVNNDNSFEKYFCGNVRGHLVGDNSGTTGMKKTIEKEPMNFVKYNNGITITGEVELQEGTGKIKVTNPIINNGQQTVKNLIRFADSIDISDVQLLIVVKNEHNDVIKGKIARYTNTQQLIKPIDLLSLESFIRDLQKELLDNTLNEDGSLEGYFLDINTSGERGYEALVKKIIHPSRKISLTEFLRIYFSASDKDLSGWKNSISKKMEEILNSTNKKINLDDAINICDTIRNFKAYLLTVPAGTERNDLRSADLAFLYLMYEKRLTEKEAHKIINRINHLFHYSLDEKNRTKLIDIYKSSSIYERLTEAYNWYIEQ